MGSAQLDDDDQEHIERVKLDPSSERRKSTRNARRNTKYVNYADDSDENFGDSGEEIVEEEDDSPKIEKILARRRQREFSHLPKSDLDNHFEVLAKYKGLSYLHVEWLEENEIRKKGTREKVMLQRYITAWQRKHREGDIGGDEDDSERMDLDWMDGKSKPGRGTTKPKSETTSESKENGGEPEDDEDEDNTKYFNPNFVEVERILDMREELVPEVSEEQDTSISNSIDNDKSAVVAGSPGNSSNTENVALNTESQPSNPTSNITAVQEPSQPILTSVNNQSMTSPATHVPMNGVIDSSGSTTTALPNASSTLNQTDIKLPQVSQTTKLEGETSSTTAKTTTKDSPAPKMVKKLMYLVKWCDLSYSECTWEWATSIDDDIKVAMFHRVNRPPAGLMVKGKRGRPKTKKISRAAMISQRAPKVPAWQTFYRQYQKTHSNVEEKKLYPICIPFCLYGFINQGEAAGCLRDGDEVVRVNGVPCIGLPLANVTNLIQQAAQMANNYNSVGRELVIRRVHTDPVTKVKSHRLFNVIFAPGPIGVILVHPETPESEFGRNHHPYIPSAHFTRFLLPGVSGSQMAQEPDYGFDKTLRKAFINTVTLLESMVKRKPNLRSIAIQAGVGLNKIRAWLKGSKFSFLKQVEGRLRFWILRIQALIELSGSIFIAERELECLMASPLSGESMVRQLRSILAARDILKVSQPTRTPVEEIQDMLTIFDVNQTMHSMLEPVEKNDKADRVHRTSTEQDVPLPVVQCAYDMLDEVVVRAEHEVVGVFSKPKPDHALQLSTHTMQIARRGAEPHLVAKSMCRRSRLLIRILNDSDPFCDIPKHAYFTPAKAATQNTLFQDATIEYNKLKDARQQVIAQIDREVRETRELEKQEKVKEVRYVEDSGPAGALNQRRIIQQLRSKTFKPYTAANPPRFKHGHQLRSYQLDGVNWILSRYYRGTSCILADEMGLGKTVQVVATIEHLRTKEGLRGPYLIIAPLSTIGHWHREVEGWTDMNMCKYYDSGDGRAVIRMYEWYYNNVGGRQDVVKFHVLVTTYETFMADVEHLTRIPWTSVVVDEGHRLRSSKSKLLDQLNRIQGTHKLLLTGTPIQNNITELYTLLNFCDPVVFGNKERFLTKYDNLTSSDRLQELQNEIAPYMMRRVKEDVEKSIPPKEETIIDVELTKLQKLYYRAIFEKNRSFLYKGCSAGNKPKLINVEMELRKCCNHPFLIAGVHEKELDTVYDEVREEYRESNHLRKRSSWSAEHEANFERQYAVAKVDRTVQASGKLVLVDKLLPKLKQEGHKVLIFSQMVRILDLLGWYMEKRGYQYERLDGSVMGSKRQAAIDRFSKKGSDSFVFLLSTRAGGVGINLTAADTAIIFDSDWNPQNDAQAQARCHRIGQTNAVRIYRLVTKHTYEETMLDRAARKLGLEQAVLGGVRSSNEGITGKNMKPRELEKMLREGAYHHLMEEDNSASNKFVEADIDQLLKTNTRTVTVDTVRGGVALKGESTVNKTSFKVEGDDDVELHDPDFWEKVLPDEMTPDVLLAKVNDREEFNAIKKNRDMLETYMSDVETLVHDMLEQRAAGELVDQHDMDTTLSLLVQVANMPNTFGVTFDCQVTSRTEKFHILADEWVGALERSRQRRCRTVTETPSATSSSRRGRVQNKRYTDPGSDGEDGQTRNRRQSLATKGKVRGKSKGRGRSKTPTRKTKRRNSSDDDDDDSQSDNGQSDVCVLCAEGGILVVCEGNCHRAFHVACLDIEEKDIAKSKQWLCPDCVSGQHLCLICGEIGKDDVVGGVFNCSVDKCGRFYHRSCLKNSKLVEWDANNQEFKCPLHRCTVCEGKSGVEMRCMQCSKGFHKKCVDATHTMVLNASSLICPDHLGGREFEPSKLLEYSVEDGVQDEDYEDEEGEMEVEEAEHAQDRSQSVPDEVNLNWADDLEDSSLELWQNCELKYPCVLCGADGCVPPVEIGENEPSTVPLLLPNPFVQSLSSTKSKSVWVHQNCANYSAEVWTDDNNQYHNVLKAIRRSRFVKCFSCTRRGATIGCSDEKCKRSMHYECAVRDGWDFEKYGHTFFCSAHSKGKKLELRRATKEAKVKQQEEEKRARAEEKIAAREERQRAKEAEREAKLQERQAEKEARLKAKQDAKIERQRLREAKRAEKLRIKKEKAETRKRRTPSKGSARRRSSKKSAKTIKTQKRRRSKSSASESNSSSNESSSDSSSSSGESSDEEEHEKELYESSSDGNDDADTAKPSLLSVTLKRKKVDGSDQDSRQDIDDDSNQESGQELFGERDGKRFKLKLLMSGND